MVVWMAADRMVANRSYIVKQGGRQVTGAIDTLRYRVDVNTLHREEMSRIGWTGLKSPIPLRIGWSQRCFIPLLVNAMVIILTS